MKLSKTTFDLAVIAFNKKGGAETAKLKLIDTMIADGFRSTMFKATISKGVENSDYDADAHESLKLAMIASDAFGADRRALLNADMKVLTAGQKKDRRDAMMRIGAYVGNVIRDLKNREEKVQAEKEKADRREALNKKLAKLKTEKAKAKHIAEFNKAEKEVAKKKTRAVKTPVNPKAEFVASLQIAWRLAPKVDGISQTDRDTINAIIAKLEG